MSEPAVCTIPELARKDRTPMLGAVFKSAVRAIVPPVCTSNVPAEIRASSAADNSSVFAAVLPMEPKSMSTNSFSGRMITAPGVAIAPPSAIRSPINTTVPAFPVAASKPERSSANALPSLLAPETVRLWPAVRVEPDNARTPVAPVPEISIEPNGADTVPFRPTMTPAPWPLPPVSGVGAPPIVTLPSVAVTLAVAPLSPITTP